MRQAVDELGAVVAYNEYDPYGNPYFLLPAPYAFTGEWWQDNLDLLYLRARWYAPTTGTFLSVDPVESQPPYQYVGGNVVNSVDPSGMQPPPQTPPPTGTPRPPWNPPPTPPTGTPMPPYTPPPMEYILNKGIVFPPQPCLPSKFSAGGYAEGWSGSLTGLGVVWWQEGSEIVYDFATMERARFKYHGVPPEGSEGARLVGVNLAFAELGTTWYAIDLNQFDSWKNLRDEYSKRFASVSIGVNTPVAEVGGGVMFVWSPNFEVTGIGYFNLAGIAPPSPDAVAGSVNWSYYSIAEPDNDGFAISYRSGTNHTVTHDDYKLMRNDIQIGKYVPPHPNEKSKLFPRITRLRNQAVRELDWVWKTYYE